jgi:hypothetical protein
MMLDWRIVLSVVRRCTAGQNLPVLFKLASPG